MTLLKNSTSCGRPATRNPKTRPNQREKPETALTAARGLCKLRKSWSKVRFRSETKPGSRRSGPGLKNQIPIPKQTFWTGTRKPNSYPSTRMNGSTDSCAGQQAILDNLTSRLTQQQQLLEVLEQLPVAQSQAPTAIVPTLRRRVGDLRRQVREAEVRLAECRRVQAARPRLVDVKLTQSGLVTRPMPPMPLVAGKTTLLRGSARLVNPSARINAAWLDVIREDTGTVAGSVQGYAIGDDHHSLSDVIGPDEHVHFFISRSLVEAEGSYRFEWRLDVDGVTSTGTALSGIQYRENAGVPMVVISFDEGILTSLNALFVFSDHMWHTARIFPVKDSISPLEPAGGFGGTGGIRFEYVGEIPLPEQGSLLDNQRTGFVAYENEFVLWDMMVDRAPYPPVFWAGRFLAFNFTFKEDLDRDGTFSNDERAKVLAPSGGGNSPSLNRVNNFGQRIIRELQSQREVVSRVSATEWPEYGMAFVTDLQNRTIWVGYASVWCTIWPELGWNEQFPVFAHELAHGWQLGHSTSNISEPAYDLLGKRRVPEPKDVMADPLDKPLRDSFLNDSDYDLVHAGIVERIPRQLERNRAGQPIAERTTGTSESGLRTFFVGTLHPGGYVEVAAAGPYASGGRRIQGDDITLRLLDDNDREIGRGGLGFVVRPKAVHDQDPPASADRQVFAGELAFNERVRTVVVERRGRELKRLKVPGTGSDCRHLDAHARLRQRLGRPPVDWYRPRQLPAELRRESALPLDGAGRNLGQPSPSIWPARSDDAAARRRRCLVARRGDQWVPQGRGHGQRSAGTRPLSVRVHPFACRRR